MLCLDTVRSWPARRTSIGGFSPNTGGLAGTRGGHFHTSDELALELKDAGLLQVEVVGVEGPAGLALEQLAEVDEDIHQAALTLARAADGQRAALDLSNHLLGIGRRS